MTVSESFVPPASLGHLPGSLETLGRSLGGRRGRLGLQLPPSRGRAGPGTPVLPELPGELSVFRSLSARSHLRARADRAHLS